jgi:hypothetical protein
VLGLRIGIFIFVFFGSLLCLPVVTSAIATAGLMTRPSTKIFGIAVLLAGVSLGLLSAFVPWYSDWFQSGFFPGAFGFAVGS